MPGYNYFAELFLASFSFTGVFTAFLDVDFFAEAFFTIAFFLTAKVFSV